MSFRRLAMISAPLASIALGTAPALAQGHAHVEQGQVAPVPPAPPMPAAPAMPAAPDMRPMWHGAGAAPMMPDDRTRDAWLNECHRRTQMYYSGYRKHRRHRDNDRDYERGPSYCEAYFDDYYRNYRGHAYGYAYVVPVAAPMMMHAPMAQPQQQDCREVETVTYEPVRTRIIPRRAAPRRIIPDKRIRVAPDKRQPMD